MYATKSRGSKIALIARVPAHIDAEVWHDLIYFDAEDDSDLFSVFFRLETAAKV